MAAVVRAEGLTKRFGANLVLSEAEFEIGEGIWGLLGENGAGKTTLIGLVLGLLAPDGGTLETLGSDPRRHGPEVRARIGYSPEHQLFPADLPAIDFVEHMCELHGIPRRHAATRASDSLWWVDLGEERYRSLGTLSVGQRQRVKLAAALAFDPALLLLDEPTDGLDPSQRDAMLALISRVGALSGITIVMASHLLDDVERTCDRILLLDHGVVRDLGSTRAIGPATAFELVVDGDVGAFVAQIERSGQRVVATDVLGRHLSIPVVGSERDLLELIQRVAIDCAVGVRELIPTRPGLSDVFGGGSPP